MARLRVVKDEALEWGFGVGKRLAEGLGASNGSRLVLLGRHGAQELILAGSVALRAEGELLVGRCLASSEDFQDIEYSAFVVPDAALPIAERLILQADEVSSESHEACLRMGLKQEQAVLACKRAYEAHGLVWHALVTPHGSKGAASGSEPCGSWSCEEWRLWLAARGLGVVVDGSEITVLASSSWQVKASSPPADAGRMLDPVFAGGLRGVVAGPHVTEALGWLTAMAEGRGRRLAVLSAAQLIEVGGDLASLRRWLLRQLEPPDGPLIVLLRPTEWFGAATDVPGLLRQVADRCEWSGRDLALVSLLVSGPSRSWRNVFHEVIQLESQLFSALGSESKLLGSKKSTRCVGEMCGLPKEIEDWLRGAAGPSALMLVGRSGSGKSTLLASLPLCVKALPMAIPLLIHAAVGDTQQAVRRHFEQAHLLQPCCVTLDDADVLFAGLQEESWNHGVSDLLEELVQMLDQFCSSRLLFLATCTEREAIPAALACRVHFIQHPGS